MNKVILIGRMTADPVLRKTRSGSDILYVTLAINGKETTFVPVKAFGATAKLISEWGHKGKQIAVCGHIAMSKSEKDTYPKMELICDRLDLLGSKGDGAAAGDGPEPEQTGEEPYDPFA